MKRPDAIDESDARLCQVAGVYRERVPASALRGHVDRVWSNEIREPARLEIVPDGCIDIYWTGQELRIAGPNTQIVSAEVTAAASLVGVRFLPGIAFQWLRVPASELLNSHPSLEDCWGRRATAGLSDRLAHAKKSSSAAAILEHALLGRLNRIAPPSAIVRATVAAAGSTAAVPGGISRSLSSEFGWSERTLRRRCHEAFGYGAKTLERILRFQTFLRLLGRSGRTRLSELAVEAGYADQAHLAREVRRLCGYSPRSLMAQLRLQS